MKAVFLALIVLVFFSGCTKVAENGDSNTVIQSADINSDIPDLNPNMNELNDEVSPPENSLPKQNITFKVYENPSLGVKLKYPEQWLSATTEDTSAIVFFSSIPPAKAIFAIALNKESVDQTLDELNQDAIKRLTTEMHSMKQNPNSIQIGGSYAKQIFYDIDEAGQKLKTSEIITIKNKKLYTIVYKLNEESLQDYFPIVQEMIDSIEFITLPSINGFSSYEGQNLGLKAQYPSDWSVVDESALSYITFSPPESSAKVSIGAGKFNLEYRVEEFGQMRMVNLFWAYTPASAKEPRVSTVETVSTSVGGKPASKSGYKIKKETGTVKISETIFVYQDKFYVVQFEANETDYERYFEKFEAIVGSIQFSNSLLQNTKNDYSCPNGDLVQNYNDCSSENPDSMIIALAPDFTLKLSDIDQDYQQISQPSFLQSEGYQYDFVAYWPDGADFQEAPKMGYELKQVTYIAYSENLPKSIEAVKKLGEFSKEKGSIIEEEILGDESALYKSGDTFYSLEFRKKNVLIDISLDTETLPEESAIKKLKSFANKVYERVGKALRVKPMPTPETDNIFGNCKNEKTCESGLYCDKSQFCSMTPNGATCSDEGGERCHKLCYLDVDCQDLCKNKIDCTKKIAKCTGTITYYSGDTLSPMSVCMVFNKT